MKSKVINIYLLLLFLLASLAVSAQESERQFKILNAANALADNSAQVVVCTKTGRMVISTIGNINFFDGNSFAHVDTRSEYQYQLPFYRGKDRLYFDRYHHLWVKTAGFVTCVDLLQERFIEKIDPVVREEFGCKEAVLDLFTDSIGDVYFLTAEGLYGARQKQVYPLLKDRFLQEVDVIGNTLYTFYDSGEEVGIDLDSRNIEHRTKAYNADLGERYMATSFMLRYHDGFLQIRNGEKEGILLQFDVKEKTWRTLLTTDYRLNDMALRDDSLLYLATERGYLVYNLNTGEKEETETFKLMGSGREVKTSVNTIAFDRQKGLWLGTEERGLLYAHPTNVPFKVWRIDEPEAQLYLKKLSNVTSYVGEFQGIRSNCQMKDSRDWTWFGTTRGLYMYRSPQAEPLVFTKRNGLLNDVIHCIVEDKNRNVWVGTSCGISVILFDEKDKTKNYFANSFNAEDDVPNEAFLNGKAICLDDGRIVMQTVDHVVVFDPAIFNTTNRKNSQRMYPKLIRMLVNGNYVHPGETVDGNVIIDRAITRVREINLNADQNSVSLTFSALNYFRPLQTIYRVKVEGVDEDWVYHSYFDGKGFVDSKGMLHLPLVGLKPGSYMVAVQASMFPDVWPDEKPYTWEIRVNQPWWQSVGVYVVLGVLVILMLLVNFLFYNKNMRLRATLNGEESEIIRKIRGFIDRCDAYMQNSFAPSVDDSFEGSSVNALSDEFITIMEKIIPFVRQQKKRQFTMRQLAAVADVDVPHLFEVLTAHLYKSPRALVRHLLLEGAAQQLRDTDLSVEQIARDCTFYTPNYFMGSFFHQYKMTPDEYRRENR